MPLATIHLFSLAERSQLLSLLQFIKKSPVQPLVLSKPIRWIIKPEHIQADSLLSPTWDLLLIVQDTKPSQDLIASILSPSPYDTTSNNKRDFRIEQHYYFSAGVPSRLIKDFNTKVNPELLHPQKSPLELTGALDGKPLIEDSSQTLALSPELQSWIGKSKSSLPVDGAISMLNLLSFREGMKASYLKYGAAFAKTIGAKRGGNAKLVGNVVQKSTAVGSAETNKGEKSAGSEEKQGIWHEFALAHYPTLLHFADMLASEDYQSVNKEFRVPALADTCILCTSELEIEKILGGDKVPAKL